MSKKKTTVNYLEPDVDASDNAFFILVLVLFVILGIGIWASANSKPRSKEPLSGLEQMLVDRENDSYEANQTENFLFGVYI